jgi:hypothetical protein
MPAVEVRLRQVHCVHDAASLGMVLLPRQCIGSGSRAPRDSSSASRRNSSGYWLAHKVVCGVAVGGGVSVERVGIGGCYSTHMPQLPLTPSHAAN